MLIAGDVTAKIVASTTGSDADWVVKLIDVFPDSIPDDWKLGGYQLMVAHEIMRGRYRKSFSAPEPLEPDTPLDFTVDLHQQIYQLQEGPPDHGADPEHLVPGLRSQSADLGAQHLQGEGVGLPGADAPHLAHARHCRRASRSRSCPTVGGSTRSAGRRPDRPARRAARGDSRRAPPPAASATGTARKVTRSVAETPKSWLRMNRAPANEAARPSVVATPMMRSPRATTIRTTSPRPAPSAMRIPISRVRCATAYDMTPYTPITASTSARSANGDGEHRRELLRRDVAVHQ